MWCETCKGDGGLTPAVANCKLKLDSVDWLGPPALSPAQVDGVLRYRDQVALCATHLQELTASRLVFQPDTLVVSVVGHAA
jgi:hypothetical protein